MFGLEKKWATKLATKLQQVAQDQYIRAQDAGGTPAGNLHNSAGYTLTLLAAALLEVVADD